VHCLPISVDWYYSIIAVGYNVRGLQTMPWLAPAFQGYLISAAIFTIYSALESHSETKPFVA